MNNKLIAERRIVNYTEVRSCERQLELRSLHYSGGTDITTKTLCQCPDQYLKQVSPEHKEQVLSIEPYSILFLLIVTFCTFAVHFLLAKLITRVAISGHADCIDFQNSCISRCR